MHEDSTKIDIFDNCFLKDCNIFNNGVIIKRRMNISLNIQIMMKKCKL